MIVAISKDGFINHLGEKHASDWTSPEDQKHFRSTLERFGLQMMGFNTYTANKDQIRLSAQRRRIVFTRSPSTQTNVSGQLEFTNEPVAGLISRMEDAGYNTGLLLGGGQMFSQFLHNKLIDEAYITVEPLLFGKGIPFLPNRETMDEFDYLVLANEAPMNASGTVMQHYIRK